jgi:PPOX class probable F420-dependent enzyme
MDVPAPLRYLLDSTAVAFVSTIGPRGEPQTTPLWFLHDAGAVRISLVEGRQKLRNLRRDPRISLVVVDPARPTRYVELRGRVDGLAPDPDRELERRIARKYAPVAPAAASQADPEEDALPRYAATVVVEKVTSQNW